MSSQAVAKKVLASSNPAPIGGALRNIILTLTLTVGSLALAGYTGRETGYEMLIVTMGWPHVILGFLFYFGRVLRGEANARFFFLLLALLTLAIWAVHYNYAITGLIYLYFLYHAFRDEIFVYLQTRSRHRPGPSVYAVAGVGPLILLMLLIPKQQDFRQDLRRVEFTGAQINRAGWTLIPFRPVANSRSRDFYLYLQAPHTAGLEAFKTWGTAGDSRSDGEFLVGDRRWPALADLVFQPHYADDKEAVNRDLPPPEGTTGVRLTGGHRVGQTFTAGQNNLDGIWLPITRMQSDADATRFIFHLASPPLLPYSRLLTDLRAVLLVLLSLVVIWRLIPRQGNSSQLWIYLVVLAGGFACTQMILKSSSNAGYAFPLIFQFVVVFHYWSWYVFSFDKLRVNQGRPVNAIDDASVYDRLLGRLRKAPNFTLAVVVLNLISAAGVLWYYRLGGLGGLRYAFDYNYFLYFLVFHVTFSFNPKPRKA